MHIASSFWLSPRRLDLISFHHPFSPAGPSKRKEETEEDDNLSSSSSPATIPSRIEREKSLTVVDTSLL